MLINKFLNNVQKLAPFSRRARPKPEEAQSQSEQEREETSSALKIVHAGGIVECYYMAIPAVAIMKKLYPSFILARPQVFRRPWEWDSLVGSDEILTPGQKLYVVPRRTVRKLIRPRIKKPNIGEVGVNSIDVSNDIGFTSISFFQGKEVMMMGESSEVSGSFMSCRKKNGTKKKHVRFVGIDGKKSKSAANVESQQEGGKRKPKYGDLWQPSLTAISERHGLTAE